MDNRKVSNLTDGIIHFVSTQDGSPYETIAALRSASDLISNVIEQEREAFMTKSMIDNINGIGKKE